MAGQRKKACSRCRIVVAASEEVCPKCWGPLRGFIRIVDGLQRGKRQDIPGQLPLPLTKRPGEVQRDDAL